MFRTALIVRLIFPDRVPVVGLLPTYNTRMAADREPPALADYAVTAISPVLIVLMVGSLVFFLVEVLHGGKYSERLLYTLFFFVIGAVLVARIAIQIDPGRAAMYGVGLGVVTFLAMNAYVDYPAGTPLRGLAWLVNLGLMALIWWSANKLTWDCTHIDENRDASGRGLLSAAGLEADADQTAGDAALENERPPEEPAEGRKKGKKKKKKAGPPLFAWLERYRKYRAAQREKPHTPGVWVIYFSLAALPLFALGQSLIAADDANRRRATFLQMAAYVGSGLGLLVITSFLGLRRYLRQRNAKVPASLTAAWLGFGAVLIVVFLALGAFLPRPHSEVPWFGLPRAGKSDREASKYAILKDSAGKGEGAGGNVNKKGDGNASGKNGEAGGSKGSKGSGGGKGQDKGGGKSGEKGDGKSDSADKGDAKDGKSQDKSSRDKSDDKSSESGDRSDREADDAKEKGASDNKGNDGSAPKSGAMAAVEKVAGFLKWVVFAIVAVLVVIGVALGVLRFLSPFTSWAKNLLDSIRNWWANLFGRRSSNPREVEEASAGRGPVRPPPFNTFSNPFTDGTAEGREPAELVEYTFAALDSWAWDRGHGRPPTETPLEFAARLGDEFPGFTATIRRLANLYARVAYSDGQLPADTRTFLEQVWEQFIHGFEEAPVAD